MPTAFRTLSLLFAFSISGLLLDATHAKEAVVVAKLDDGKQISVWQTLGPFSAPDAFENPQFFLYDPLSKSGGESSLSPETETVNVGDSEYVWKKLDAGDGIPSLASLLETENERASGYAHTWIDSDRARKLMLAVGSDDGLKVWLNGKLVHSKDSEREFAKDSDVFGVELKQGKNSLLLRIDKIGTSWKFSCRQLVGDELNQHFVKSAAQGDLEMVRTSLTHGADINAKSKRGYTAYAAAYRSGYVSLANELVAKGAKTDIEVPKFDEYLDGILSEQFNESTPACVVLVARNGDIVFQNAYGQADLSKKTPATIDTKFRIGSVSKQFTAAAILKLQEEGKLKVTDKLSKFMPNFPRGDEVTLHHLLTHTSGIVSYTSKPEFWQKVTKSATEKRVIQMFRNDEFEFDPGSRYSYCNSGYFLLGHIVGLVSESSFEEYLKTNFFAPLKMKDSGIHRKELDLSNEAKGYSVSGTDSSVALNWDMTWAGGAGAIYSTVGDLFRWNEAVFSHRVISKASLEQAFAPTKLNDGSISDYGYGWGIGSRRHLPLYSHGGGLQGFLTYLGRYPEQNTTIAIFVNASPTGDLPSPATLEARIANAFLWRDMKPRQVFAVDSNVDASTFDALVGNYDYGAATMEVTVADNRVYAQLSGQGRHEIYPYATDKFFWKGIDAQVEFKRDGAGKVVRGIHTQNGSTLNVAKLKDGLQIAAEKLQKFVGRYDYRSGVMTVTRRGKQLFARMTGQPRFALFPETENKFAWKVVVADVEFVEGDDGKIVKAIHNQGGRKFDAPRLPDIKRVRVSSERLESYVGEYNLGLFRGKLSVTREGDKIFGKMRGQSKLEVVPTGDDELTWIEVPAQIKFERDENGAISNAVLIQSGTEIKATRVKE